MVAHVQNARLGSTHVDSTAVRRLSLQMAAPVELFAKDCRDRMRCRLRRPRHLRLHSPFARRAMSVPVFARRMCRRQIDGVSIGGSDDEYVSSRCDELSIPVLPLLSLRVLLDPTTSTIAADPQMACHLT